VIYSLGTGAGNSLFYDFSQDTTRQGKPDDVSPVTDGWPELMIGTAPKQTVLPHAVDLEIFREKYLLRL
jgi:hypothetical protein